MRTGLFALLLLLLTMASGCWDMREVTDLGIVIGAAFEEAEIPDNIRLTYQIVIPGQISGTEAGKGKAESPPVRVGTSTGPTVFSAVRAFVTSASRRLFWGHNQLLIIDQKLARKGVTPFMDFYMRDPEPRPDVPVLISLTSAGDILRVHDGIETIPAMGLNENLRTSADNGFCPLVVMEDFMESMHSKSQAAIAPIISLFTERGFEGKVTKRARFGGTAVFAQGRMVGQLNLQQTRGLLWALNQRKTGIIPLRYKGKAIGIEIIDAQGNIYPEINKGVLKVIIDVKLKGNLGEMQASEDITPQLISTLAKQQNEVIRQEVWAMVRASQAMNADILGMANTIYHHNPQAWHSIETKWSEYYPQIPVDVKITSQIIYIGNTDKGMQ